MSYIMFSLSITRIKFHILYPKINPLLIKLKILNRILIILFVCQTKITESSTTFLKLTNDSTNIKPSIMVLIFYKFKI